MFSKRKEIDEVELGAELYLKGFKESKQAFTTENSMIISSQKPETHLKKHKKYKK